MHSRFLRVGIVVLFGSCTSSSFERNERIAQSSLIQIVEGEEMFRFIDWEENGINDFWVGDVSGLFRVAAERTGLRFMEGTIAAADTRPLAAGKEPGGAELGAMLINSRKPSHGYYFRVIRSYESEEGKIVAYSDGKNRNPDRYGYCAFPAEYGSTGNLTFVVNDTHDLWKMDTNGAPIDLFPLDPPTKGWLQVREIPIRLRTKSMIIAGEEKSRAALVQGAKEALIVFCRKNEQFQKFLTATETEPQKSTGETINVGPWDVDIDAMSFSLKTETALYRGRFGLESNLATIRAEVIRVLKP